MPIEIKELIIRASVEARRENTQTRSTDSNKDAQANRRLSELMKVKKIIEQKNER